jgi:hypothetical protein
MIIRRYNRLCLLWGVPGLALEMLGTVLTWRGPVDDFRSWIVGSILTWAGIGLLIVGLSYYARAKGRHPAWGLLGLLSLFGILLAFGLRNHYWRELDRMRRGLCPRCEYDLRHDLDQGCPECGWHREAAKT